MTPSSSPAVAPPASAGAPAAPATAIYRLRWVCLAVVLVAEIMDLLDSTVITIAAPTVRSELGGSASTMQWWAAGYTLAFGVFMIIGGRLGDVFGRKRVFVVGIVGFTLASAACALATSPDVLIATRILQGGFGALLIPQGLGIIKTVFPPSEMGGAFAAFGPVMGLAAVGGPVLAGWLVSADLFGTGWRMIFLINLPLGVLGLVGALRFFPESRSPERLRLDPLGVVLIAAATTCLIYPLVQGRELGWPLWAFGMMAAGVVLLGVFASVERRGHGTPLIEPSLLRNRAFSSGLIVGLAFFAGFAGLLLVLSVFLQGGLGFSAEHAGLTFIPATLASAVAAGASFPLMAKFGRGVLQAGVLTIIAALGILAALVDHGGTGLTTWGLVPALVPFGIGLGFVFGPLFNVILAGVDDREVGSASGTLNAVQQLGNSIGVALLATIFFSLTDHGHASATAMRDTTLISAGLFVVAFGLSFLLPREARMDDPQ
ncbi:MAG: drug resistance transporter, EmrB/QacA subfamily [Conexibacter sp.]|nr:drug resistance transporter, EmrB/QacA subfamily [Conexibacter sp.]